MANKRPSKRAKLFIGSSTESVDVAYAIQENLQHDAEVTVWPQGVFSLSQPAIQSLADELAQSDFGVFVFSPDDRTRLRSLAQRTVRDNVVFELGLFAGRLGIARNFIVMPNDGKPLHLPTDLTGVTPGQYDATRDDANLAAALGPFCNQVRRAIAKLGVAHPSVRRGKKATHSLRHITFHSAQYGSGPHRVDVRNALVKELRAGGVAYVGNQLAGDPTPNVQKDLELDFSVRGTRSHATIPEGKSIFFPEVAK